MCFVWIWEHTFIISLYDINWLVYRCICRIVKSDYWLRHICPYVCISACLFTRENSAATGEIFTKCDIWAFFENLLRKFKFYEHLTRITGALHEDICTFMILSCWFLLRMRNASMEVVEKIKTHILWSITFLWKSCHLPDNVEKYTKVRQATDDNIMWPRNYATLQTQP